MNIRKIIKKLEKIGALRTVSIETAKNEVTVTFNDGLITKTRAAKNEFVKAVDEQFRGKGYNYMIDFREGICYLTVIERNFSHMLDALLLYSPVYSGASRKSRVTRFDEQDPRLRSMRIYVDPANTDSNPTAYMFYSPYPIHSKGDDTNPKDAINNQKPQ
ncbi:hypothetical protein [Elizabethkingia anophelis]|uniref:hypothetical protein n=1 Tax=Elizabethkingia anophelis TaxID=1117645 RepID=UPI001EE64409|nr:hypothetical protein [Elizabethkingia anophelis]UKY91077.1 hypothetical protein KUF64_05045 [Elizabethkingia anophelis]UKY98248.1 hypothetical protein KUF68_05050 [Elizabethkingia anophelis]